MRQTPDNIPPKQPDSSGTALRRYAGMGSEFAGAICGLTLAGYWVDRHYGTGVKATVIGALLGVVGGSYNFIRQALEMSREAMAEQKRAEEQHDHPRASDHHDDAGSTHG